MPGYALLNKITNIVVTARAMRDAPKVKSTSGLSFSGLLFAPGVSADGSKKS